MSEPCTVVIGAPELLDALRERAGAAGDILTFSHHDAVKALEAIAARHPSVVALERLFAATSRGAALINRIKADPSMASAQVHVVSHDGSYSRVSPRRTLPSPPAARAGPAVAATPQTPAVPADWLDYHGTRCAPRHRLIDGTDVQVDGASAKIIDVSLSGAQVVSPAVLRPQQRVSVVLSDDAAVVRVQASVVWASFELRGSEPRYRAGLEFADADADAAAIEAFRTRHEEI